MTKHYNLLETVRFREWWEPKLSVVLAVTYATAQILDISIASLWPALLWVLAALTPDAAYAAVINEVMDRSDDAAAAKANRIAGRSILYVTTLIAIAISAGVIVAVAWRDDPLLMWIYVAAWLPFSLYSLPPFRLKKRGIAGVIADGAGAHLFPALVAILVVYHFAGRYADWTWIALIGLWSLALGMRCILWHQIRDRENDAGIGVATFVVRHRPTTVEKIAAGIFGLEVAALGLILFCVGELLPIVALAAYGILVLLRRRRLGTGASIMPKLLRSDVMLYEYYVAFMPVSLLLASAIRYPADLLVLVVHLVLFPQVAGHALKDGWRIINPSAAKKVLATAECPVEAQPSRRRSR